MTPPGSTRKAIPDTLKHFGDGGARPERGQRASRAPCETAHACLAPGPEPLNPQPASSTKAIST